jgi:hypothetical protein
MPEVIEGLSFPDYCLRKALHSTMVARVAQLSWRHAQGPMDDTASFLKGRAAHCRILQPSEYSSRYMSLPSTDGIRNKDGSVSQNPSMTTEYKNRVREIRLKNPEMELMDKADFDSIERMAESALKHAGQHLTGLKTEVSLFFDIDGTACKARPDGYDRERKLVVELKTTKCAHPRNFAFDCRNYCYGIQMAWQGISISRAMDWVPANYIIVAVENTPPFCCSVHRLALGWISECENRCLQIVEEYRNLPKEGAWPGYSPLVNVIDFSTGDDA